MKKLINLNYSNPKNNPMFLGEDLGIQRYDQFKYEYLYRLYQQQLGQFWRPEEVSLIKDRVDFKRLDKEQQFVFVKNLAYQTILDTDQARGLRLLANYVSIPELELFINVWLFFEQIHSESYTHIIRNILPDIDKFWEENLKDKELLKRVKSTTEEYDKLLNINTTNTQKLKESIFDLVVAINILESIRFFVSFACSFSFVEQSPASMEGNAKIIQLIKNDEECVLPNTELLTKEGWKKIQDITEDDLIAQYDMETKEITYSKPLKKIWKWYSGKVYKITRSSKSEHTEERIIQYITENHDLVITQKDKYGNMKTFKQKASISNINNVFWYLPISGYKKGKKNKLTDYERLLISIQADGTVDKQRRGQITGCQVVHLVLSKKRKKDRLENLLNNLEIEYTTREVKDGKLVYYIKIPHKYQVFKKFKDWVNINDVSTEWIREFLEELSLWDGYRKPEDDNYREFIATSKEDFEIVLRLLVHSGYKFKYRIQKDNKKDTYKDVYHICWWKNKEGYLPYQSLNVKEEYYEGYVGCVSMPKGTIITRYNDIPCITGNCHCIATQYILKKWREKENEGFIDIWKSKEDKVYEMYYKAVQEEIEWARYLFKDNPKLLGLNDKILERYMKWLTDKRLRQIGLKPIFNEDRENPMSWIEKYNSKRQINVAPQESELESYNIGQYINDLDTAKDNLKKEFKFDF